MSLLHLTMPPLILASLENLPWVAIIAVGASMLMTIIAIVGGLIIAYHRQKQWHETARLALEKGQPLPTQLDEASRPQPRIKGPGHDLRAGLILIATGAGLFVFFDALIGRGMAYLGAIPGFIGIALVLYVALTQLFRGNDTPPADRP